MTKYHGLGVFKNTCFLIVLQAGSLRSKWGWCCFLLRLCRLPDGAVSSYSLLAFPLYIGASSVSSSSFKDTDPIGLGPYLIMTSFNLNTSLNIQYLSSIQIPT